MRIAYVCADPGVPVWGRKGCSVHVQEVIRALRQEGAEVTLFATRLDGTPPAHVADVPLHRLPDLPRRDEASRERAALAANVHLRRALRDAGPFDLIYERYSLWSHAGMTTARDEGVPGILEVNAPLVEEQVRYRQLVDRAGAQWVAAHVFRNASALIAVSEPVAAYLRHFPDAEQRVHIVPNGVNPERFPITLRRRLPREPGTFTVGFVGTLKPWHGVPPLVDAFEILYRRLPQARLLIVGDGPEREWLEQTLVARGLDEVVRRTGTVDPGDVPGLLASVDVAVAPYPEYITFYFSPLKVYEYMAAGCAVVASRIGQLQELIEDGETGLLCPPGDAKALALALERLWRAPELRARLAQAGRKHVIRHHTWQAVARKILAVALQEQRTFALTARGGR